MSRTKYKIKDLPKEERLYRDTGLFADYFSDEKLPEEKIWQKVLVENKTRN